MKMKSYIFTLLLSILFCSPVLAQNIKVEGIVSDENDVLTGVTIRTKEGNTGTISDIDGRYTLVVPQDSRLIFSYTGYRTREIAIAGKTRLDVVLSPLAKDIDEVVVIGYGTMKKRDITGAISSLNAEMLEKNSPTDLATAIQGQVAGFEVISNSGEPGSGSRMRIRGTSTLSDGGVSPLFIVDGMEVSDIDGINPRDIASIEVLKDAASAAIYGSRSANGVILITTKSGSDAIKPVVNLNYSYRLSKLAHKMPQMSRLQGNQYDLIRQYFSGVEEYTIVKDSLAPNRLLDNDYQDILFRNAPTNQINASIYGGGQKLNYYLSAAYTDEQGIMLNTYNKRLSTRANVNYQVNDKLKIGSRISIANKQRKPIVYGGLQYLSRPADYQLIETDGTYAPVMQNRRNPLAHLMLQTDKYTTYDINLSEFVEYKFMEGLSLRSSFSTNINFQRFNSFSPEILSNVNPPLRTSVDQMSQSTMWTQDNILTYEKKIQDHSFSAMAGLSLQSSNYSGVNLSVLGHPTDAAPISIGYSEVNLNATNATETSHRMASYFGRLSYSYLGKYLFNANLRADGSSRFGSDNRWGAFPSVSAGWRISDEFFMGWAKPLLNDAKLRLSYGVTGNQSAGNFASQSIYKPVYYGSYAGLYPSQLSNTYLGWEETKQFNLGLDLNLLNGRIVLTVDYYNKKTNDVLYAARLPQTTGFASTYKNVGEIGNRGFEVTLNTLNIKTKQFSWNTQLNLAKNDNEVLHIPEGGRMLVNDNLYLVEKGYSIGTMYGYNKLAIFPYDESNAFTPEGKQLTPVFDEKERFVKYVLNGSDYQGDVKKLRYNSPSGDIFKGGDVMWEDTNGDFVIDANDRQVIGNAQPWFSGGFTNDFAYKNISLSFFFTFSVGGDIFNQTEANRSNHMWSSITRANPLNVAQSWLAPGDIAKYPKPNGGAVLQNTRRESSMWVEDGSYIKLKNIKLSYRLPRRLARKIHTDKIEVFGQMNNYFVWTKYTGQDPELGAGNVFVLGYDDTVYPRSKDIQFGINLTF